MKKPTSTERHRRKQRAKGLVRVEVEAPATDAALLREVAAELRKGSRRAAELRSALRKTLKPRKQTLLEALTLDIPRDDLDRCLVRQKDYGRDIEL